MKKFVCAVLIFALLAGGVLGCVKKDEVPARGVWNGRTYTNAEAGIKMTIPEGYDIDTDEALIKWAGASGDYFDNLKSKDHYYDIHITQETSRIYIEYEVFGKSITAEQLMNIQTAYKTRDYNGETRNILYGDVIEKVLCGQTYLYCGYTLKGIDNYYGAICLRFISGDVYVLINVYGQTQEQADAYFSFFDTASVNSEK